MVNDTFSSKNACTNQIWDHYLKYYERYAPDMTILKTRSEVKVKVEVTRKWYATLYHSKMHPHTEFGIPISNNIGDMLRTLFSKPEARSTPAIMVSCDLLQ